MSDPLLPVPPEAREEPTDDPQQADLEDDREPDVLPDAADDEPVRDAADPGAFRTPQPGDRLTPEELAAETE